MTYLTTSQTSALKAIKRGKGIFDRKTLHQLEEGGYIATSTQISLKGNRISQWMKVELTDLGKEALKL